ncbi:MAG: DUF6470 family protein [Anaerotignaceae bacterium]
MNQLIKITNVPISIELKVNNSKLEYKSGNAEMNISRDDKGLRIKSESIKLNIDSFETYNSITPTAMRSIEQYAVSGKNAAYQATEAYAREGKLFINAKVGEDVITNIVKSDMEVNTNVGLEFLPSVKPEMTWSAPEMTIQYEMDKLNFDWKVQNGNFEFIPGDVEIAITQKPDLIIEYIGGPIYVPPSSDPSYVPTTDVKA